MSAYESVWMLLVFVRTCESFCVSVIIVSSYLLSYVCMCVGWGLHLRLTFMSCIFNSYLYLRICVLDLCHLYVACVFVFWMYSCFMFVFCICFCIWVSYCLFCCICVFVFAFLVYIWVGFSFALLFHLRCFRICVLQSYFVLSTHSYYISARARMCVCLICVNVCLFFLFFTLSLLYFCFVRVKSDNTRTTHSL